MSILVILLLEGVLNFSNRVFPLSSSKSFSGSLQVLKILFDPGNFPHTRHHVSSTCHLLTVYEQTQLKYPNTLPVVSVTPPLIFSLLSNHFVRMLVLQFNAQILGKNVTVILESLHKYNL